MKIVATIIFLLIILCSCQKIQTFEDFSGGLAKISENGKENYVDTLTDNNDKKVFLTYDSESKVIKMSKLDGSTTEFTYNSNEITISCFNKIEKFNLTCELDSFKRINKIKTMESTEHFTYDNLGFLVEQNSEKRKVSYKYLNSNLTEINVNTVNQKPQVIKLEYNQQKLKNLSGLLSLKELTQNYINSNLISNTPNKNWYDIAYSKKLNRYVSISTDFGDSVMVSSDGRIWEAYPTGNNNAWISITYSDELEIFVAVSSSGVGNRVMTSKDGIKWINRVSAYDNSWRAITYSPELNLFVALSISGINNRVMTSKDGINWKIINCNFNNDWRSVLWISDLKLFVAVASSGNGDRVMISYDGVNWSQKTGIKNNDWFGIAYSPKLKLIVCVADGGDDERIMISKDANNWRNISTREFNNKWHDITYSSELNTFVAVAYSGDNRIIASGDGINWCSSPTPSNNFWMSIAYDSQLNQFVSVSKSGNKDRVMITKVEDLFYGSFDYQLILQSQGYFGKLSKNLISSFYFNDTLKTNRYRINYNLNSEDLINSKNIVNEFNISKTYIYH